ncbi:MAG: TorF family putative porin [Candidatus Zixiibacteriota bacterium]
MQNRLWPFLAALLVSQLVAPSAFSQIGVRTDLTVVSRYVWRGFDCIANDRPAIQPSITLDFGKSGVWFNAWSAFALADTDFVELDLVVGYDRAFSEALSFSAGAGYFTFPSMPNYPDENSATPEVYAGVTLTSFPLSPNLTLYYDFNMGDGIYTTLSVSREFRVKEKKVSSTVLAGYTRQYRGIGVDPGFSDICLGISTDLELKGLTLTPTINYVIVPNETVNDENEIWVGLSVGWSTDETDRSTDATD